MLSPRGTREGLRVPMTEPIIPEPNFCATATAFSAAAGVLGGFSITVLVLVLPADFLKDSPHIKDCCVGLILMAAFLYVTACLLLANSMNSMMLTDARVRLQAFTNGIRLLHVANIGLASSLTILTLEFSSFFGRIVIGFVVAGAVLVAVLNFVGAGRMMRKRRA